MAAIKYSYTVYVDNTGVTSHAFLSLQVGAKREYFGFAPATNMSPIGPGRVGTGLTTHPDLDIGNQRAGFIDDVCWSRTEKITVEQYKMMRQTIQFWQDHPPHYYMWGHENCTDFVRQVLRSAHAQYPGIRSDGPNPLNLMPFSEERPFYELDSDGMRQPSERSRNPSAVVGTPAYEYKQNPTSF